MNTLTGTSKRLLLLAILLSMAGTAAAAQGFPAGATDIGSFVNCLDNVKRANGTIGDTVRCVPRGCSFTVTRSTASAQPACEAGGCILPRVIFNCTNPNTGLQFQPTYTMCVPSDAFSRNELGQEVSRGGPLMMADISVPRGTHFPDISVNAVMSNVNPGNTSGSKGCNPCHSAALSGGVGTPQLSHPIPPSPSAVLDTNVPGVAVDPQLRTSLTQICSCIANSQALAQTPNVDRQALIYLCEMLKAKTLGG